MKKTTLPFCPLPTEKMVKIAEKFQGIGAKMAVLSPKLEQELEQAEIQMEPEVYGAIMFLLPTVYFFLGALVTAIFLTRLSPENLIPGSIVIGAIFSLLILMQFLFYPKMILKKKIRDLERNLIFALRTILVEIKSGVTLFDAINIVAEGNNGQVSTEFKKAIEQIEIGHFQNEVLEGMAENNPSLYFRRAIWQIVNGLKSGADISMVMEALVENLSKEKGNQIRKYGNSLKLLSLLYMMLGAIIPALGLTFLIILSSFPQIAIDETVFWGMLGFLLIGQFMFLGIIKSSRPSLLGD